MGVQYKVVLRGFSAFERSALGSYFRLSAQRSPGYEQVQSLDDADFAVADADQPPVVEELCRQGRLNTSVFIGAHAPPGAVAWTMRPIDPLHVMRELDAIAALHHLPPTAPAAAPVADARDAGHREHPLRRAYDSQPGGFDALPIEPRARTARAATPAAPPLACALMVDDSEIALQALDRQLRALGLTTQRSLHSGQALEALARGAFDIVFIDVDLGDDSELDGLTLCRQIKSQQRTSGRPPVVVMLSAHAAAIDRVRGTLAGCDAYLAKPFDELELRLTLQRHGVPVTPLAASGH